MKAFIVFEKGNTNKTILFARTRNEARYNALFTSKFTDSKYTNIAALRIKELDFLYSEYVFEIDVEDPKVQDLLNNSKQWDKVH